MSERKTMSNDARSKFYEALCKRTFPVIRQDMLALKVLRDRLEADKMPAAFCRKVGLFYFALTQIAALEGTQRFRIDNDLMMELSFVAEKYYVDIRAYLEKIHLCRFAEEAVRGCTKQVFCSLLEISKEQP